MKLNVIKKIKNKINNSNLFEILKILALNSNHPRRIQYYIRYYLRRFGITKIGDPNDDPFYERQKKQLVKFDGTLILYIGDSNVEYFSRFNLIDGGKIVSPMAFWLGPITRLGYVNINEFHKLKKTIYKIITLKKKISKEKYEKIILVWSSGAIDIRCSFYELLLSRVFNSNLELYERYSEITLHLINQLLIPMSRELKIDKIIMISPIDSSLEGEEPQNLKDVRKLKKFQEYPTLGFKEDRKKWRKQTNEINKNICEKANIEFIDINNLLKCEILDFIMPDGVHIANPEVIIKINHEILKL